MEAKDSLIKAIKGLVEVGKPIPRATYVDLLIGKQTPEITEEQWDDTEAFGSGESHDEDYWNTLIDKALEGGYIRIRSVKRNSLEYTASGRSFVRKPTSFQIPDEEEASEAAILPDDNIDEIVQTAMEAKKPEKSISSVKTKQQIKIIHAIDRKMALDDFAETEGIDFEEVLEDLEQLQHQGRKMDITYFTNEVFSNEEMSELLEFFSDNGDNINLALKEFDNLYKEEELRLARIVWLNKK